MNEENTKSKYYRSSAWVFTINNPTPEDDPKQWNPKYCIYQTEQGENGTIHYQGYVVMSKRYSLIGMKKFNSKAHFERRKGTHAQAKTYCSKEDTRVGPIVEFGSEPTQGRRSDIEDFVTWSREQSQQPPMSLLLDFHPGIIAKYPRFASLVLNETFKTRTLEKTNNVWIYGPPRCGKSLTARVQYYGRLFNKAPNKWFDGYRNPHCLLLEDLDTTHKYMGYYLKIWGDNYPFTAEMKGSSMEIRPEAVIVTSNYSIDEIFGESPMIAAAIKARFEEKFMGPDEDRLKQLILQYNTLNDMEFNEDNVECPSIDLTAQYEELDEISTAMQTNGDESQASKTPPLPKPKTPENYPVAEALSNYRIPRSNAFIIHDSDSDTEGDDDHYLSETN